MESWFDSKMLKKVGLGICLVSVGIFISCGDVVIAEDFDPVAQLEADIVIIEDYIAKEGYVDYDTLETEVRLVILEEGTGATIEYNDFVWYDYIGSLVDSLMFDTSIRELAFKQDSTFAVDTVYVEDDNGDFIRDSDGNKIIATINFEGDYIPIYFESRNYAPFETTHTPGGWFLNQENFVNGFKTGIHHVLENTNIGGRALLLIPSGQAYSTVGTTTIPPNAPIIFEIRVVRKK